MGIMNSEAFVSGLSKNRVEALTDGIYAIAMTIAVLNIGLDQTSGWQPKTPVMDLLLGLMPQLIHYLIAFMVLASFWTALHRQFHFITHVDHKFIWYSLYSLFFISLIPFTTALVGDYSDSPASGILFAGNLFCVGVANMVAWRYANGKGRLVEKIDPDYLVYSERRAMVIPAVSVMVMIASVLIPGWETILFFAIPLIFAIIPRPAGEDVDTIPLG